MSLVSRRGSSSLPSEPTRPQEFVQGINDKTVELDGRTITDEIVVRDTFVNNTSVNTDNYRDHLTTIAGFPEGMVIITTYFSQNAPITDTASKVIDMGMETKDNVHHSYTEIRDFELRISSEINTEYDDETTVTTVTTDAIVPPQFTPMIGDLFLYQMSNGKIGVFHVTKVMRLALGQDTYHKINCTMTEFLDRERRDLLIRQTTGVFYFDKTKFVAGNIALLDSTGYIQKKKLEQLRKEIIQNYIDRFYDTSYGSFMRADGIYDPYVVEYWNKKVSYKDSYKRPTQLLIAVSNFSKTIWSLLTNNPIKRIANVSNNIDSFVYHATFWDVNITSLLGRTFITVGDEPASNPNPSMRSTDNNIDTSPSISEVIGYFPEDLRTSIAHKDFCETRHAFYEGHLVHRKCSPHQHAYDPTSFLSPIYGSQHHHPHPDEKGYIERHHVHSACHDICGAKHPCHLGNVTASDQEVFYALSKEFYLGSTCMDPLEQFIYDIINNKMVNIDRVIDVLSGYLELTDDDAFYKHMLALYLIDKCLYWLVHEA